MKKQPVYVSEYVGHLFQYPACDVHQLARDVGMEGRVRTVAFGVQDDHCLTEIWQTLNDCFECGHWLIMHNVHLAAGLWTDKLLYLLQVQLCS